MKSLLSLALFLACLMQTTLAQTPLLWEAVKSNDLPKAQTALQNGADVNARDENKATILMWAAYKSDLAMVKYLVSKGADHTKKGAIPFDTDGSYYGNLTGIATHRKDLPMLRYFIEELKIDVNDKEYNAQDNADTGWHALQWALNGGFDEATTYLISKGAILSSSDSGYERSKIRFEEYDDRINPPYTSLEEALKNPLKVTKLDLKYQNLTTLDSKIEQLKNLRVLDVSVNKLTDLPKEIGNLRNLTKLYCYRNQLTSLPATIGELESLTNLNCFDNKLTGLPATIGELKNLTNLNCSYNQLTSLPATIGKLKSLTYLNCYKNQLTSLPASIGELKSLTELDCDYNQLTSLPAEIGQLKSLTGLRCYNNQLTSLPATISELKSLTYLNCGYNQLTSLPAEIGQLKSLTSLDCGINQLTSLPAAIGALESLTYLDCKYNQLTSLPAEIGQLKSLTTLSCWHNKLTSLPAEIGQLKSLTYLYCIENQLTTLPVWIGQLQSLTLTNLYCFGNPIQALPDDRALLEKIGNITFGSRKAPIIKLPPQVSKMQYAWSLDASYNNLQEFPTEILTLSKLRQFYLTKNPFKIVPKEINQLKKLEKLCLDSLSIDALPVEIGQLTNLEQLNLIDTRIAQPIDERLFPFLEKFAFGGNVQIAMQVGKTLKEQTENAKKARAQAEKFRQEAENRTQVALFEKQRADKNARVAENEKENALRSETQAQKDKRKALDAEARARENETQARKAEREAHEAEQNAQTQRNIAFGVGIIAVLLGIFALYQMSIARKQRKLADIEKAKSEKLLLNILPEEVAHELKEKGITEVRQFDHASILFADVKGFSALASKVTPKELIAELDATFTKMDEISMANGLERIKTIGDCYMAVAGVPHPSPANPVDITLAALGIQKWMNDERQARGGNFWQVRLGTHTGELVAGVIGKTKFAYDVWGSAVNLASRMESGGEVGKVNTTEYTKNLINDFFNFTYRGELEAKNIGKVNAYFVDRIKPELSADVDGFVPNEQFQQLRKERFGA